jgi:hypothetical protein
MKKVQTDKKAPTELGRQGRTRNLVLLLLTIVVATLLVFTSLGGRQSPAEAAPIEFTDVQKDTLEFMNYNRTITLTPEQEAIKKTALSGMSAPCCSDRSAHTCCCSCNMAQSWWGLAKHLIANEGYDASQVKVAVEEWFDFIGPDGFTGDACYTGGCARPFHQNGCGGMNEKSVVF